MFALLPKNKVRKSAMTRGFMINLKLKIMTYERRYTLPVQSLITPQL